MEVSEIAIDLMKGLICDRSERLGRSGIQQFKEHPFFIGVNWENLRKSKCVQCIIHIIY